MFASDGSAFPREELVFVPAHGQALPGARQETGPPTSPVPGDIGCGSGDTKVPGSCLGWNKPGFNLWKVKEESQRSLPQEMEGEGRVTVPA